MNDFCNHNGYLGFGARLALQGHFNAMGEYILNESVEEKKTAISQASQPTIIDRKSADISEGQGALQLDIL
jgi:hypothetical protein